MSPAELDDPRAHELQQYFLDHMPEQGYGEGCSTVTMACIIACLVPTRLLPAVVDWEISTLGDPLADLAYALNPWSDPSDEEPPSAESATSVPGFPSRSELAQRYADRTGRNLDQLDYYIGFNRWKTAAILHGVYARYKEGKKSTEGIDLVEMKKRILDSLTLAQEAVDRLK